MTYKKYAHSVKYLISKSGNPYLFPELKIPLTTAIYWIDNKYHLNFTENACGNLLTKSYQNKIRSLEDKNRELRRRIEIVKQVHLKLNLTLSKKHVKDFELRKEIIELIYKMKKRSSIISVLKDIDLSKSRFTRWKREIRNYQKMHQINIDYKQSTSRSITKEEFHAIKELYTNPSYFHYPLYALCEMAKRDNLVYSSPATWRKYARLYKLKRPNLAVKYKSRYLVGISKLNPNELWHIDVTEIKLRGKKVFIQVIIDNYSRYVLNWNMMNQWNGLNTKDLIDKTITHYGQPLELMMDAGSENLNYHVESFLTEINLNSLVAKKNTPHSNSRIEVFFRTMKSNYLSKVKFNCRAELERNVRSYINDYNIEIPHCALNTLTPEEAFSGMPRDYYKDKFKEIETRCIRNRITQYKKNK